MLRTRTTMQPMTCFWDGTICSTNDRQIFFPFCLWMLLGQKKDVTCNDCFCNNGSVHLHVTHNYRLETLMFDMRIAVHHLIVAKVKIKCVKTDSHTKTDFDTCKNGQNDELCLKLFCLNNWICQKNLTLVKSHRLTFLLCSV